MSVTVTKRNDASRKPWVVTQYVGDKKSRKGFATEADAVAWKMALEVDESARNRWITPGALPCDDVLESWLTAYRHTLAESTEETVTGLIRNHLSPYFGPRDLRLIRDTDVTEFAGQLMEAGKSEAVAFNAVSLLRRVCTLHVEAGLLDSNPAKGAKRLVGTVARRYKKEVERIDSWTFEESRKLLEIAADQEKNIYPAVLALLHTGMRRGEMIALRWEDVDFVRSRIVIRRAKVRGKITVPKSGKAREVPISPELADVLRELAGTRHRREGFANPEWVFLSTKGLQLMERNFNRSFARLTTAAAKKKVRPLNLHCCRHTFATMALESGRNIKWVAEILGHSDPTITLRTYAHAMHKDNDDLGFLANNRGESVYRLRTASNRLRILNEARK